MNNKINRFSIECSQKEKEKRIEFGNKFKQERATQRFSIDTMSRKLNISPDLLKRIESGYVSPESPGLLEKLVKYQNSRKMVIR